MMATPVREKWGDYTVALVWKNNIIVSVTGSLAAVQLLKSLGEREYTMSEQRLGPMGRRKTSERPVVCG
jgi:hypothetical protein